MFKQLAVTFLFVVAVPVIVFAQEENAAAKKAPEKVHFQDVRVFDGERVIDRTDVLISEGVIQEIGEGLATPAGARVINGDGLTLLPGLIDCHVHAYFPAFLKQSAEYGVTTVMDMMGMPAAASRIRERQISGNAKGQSDYYSAGYAVTVKGGHGTQFGFKVPVLESADQAEAFVLERMREGSDYLKIIHEPGTAYGFTRPTLSDEMLKATIEAARKHDFKPVAHVSTLRGVQLTVDYGIAGLVHLNADAKLPDALIKQMVEKKVFVVPTTAVNQNMTGPVTVNSLIDDPNVGPLLTGMDMKNLSTSFPDNGKRLTSTENLRYNIAALEAAGVPVLAGTDAPNPGTTFGASMHHEMELLVASGLTNQQALAAATSRAADCFELADRGRIAKGKRADLLLINGNPLEDIKDTRHIDSVWKAGYPIDLQKRREKLKKASEKEDAKSSKESSDK